VVKVLFGHPAIVETELFAFEEFLKISEELLPTAKLLRYIKSNEEREGFDPIEDAGDVYVATEEAIEAAERIYPRYLRGANVVALYALLESSIDRMAESFAAKLNTELFRRRGNLDDRKKYFQKKLSQPIYCGNDSELWDRLLRLMTLRHVMAHDSGQYEYSRHYEAILGWIVSGQLVGVKLLSPEEHESPMSLEGYLAFSEDYLWGALADVKTLLEHLIERWRAL
jgi:hypothetical protein